MNRGSSNAGTKRERVVPPRRHGQPSAERNFPTEIEEARAKRKLNFDILETAPKEELEAAKEPAVAKEESDPEPDDDPEGDAIFEEAMKRDIHVFDGTEKWFAARPWLAKMDRLYEDQQCSEWKKVECMDFMLGGDAAEWWKDVISTVPDPENITWAWFKKQFVANFAVSVRTILKEEWEPVKLLSSKGIRFGDKIKSMVKIVWQKGNKKKVAWEDEEKFHDKFPELTAADLID